MQLTKGMYGTEFRSASNLFGLRCGQMRGNSWTHNSGWYNKAGEKIGWGDLSITDFKRIMVDINHDEIFIVLSESDSFWEFVTKIGTIGSMSTVEPTAEAPGIDYVAKNAMYAITHKNVYGLNRHHPVGETYALDETLNAHIIAPSQLQMFMEAC